MLENIPTFECALLCTFKCWNVFGHMPELKQMWMYAKKNSHCTSLSLSQSHTYRTGFKQTQLCFIRLYLVCFWLRSHTRTQANVNQHTQSKCMCWGKYSRHGDHLKKRFFYFYRIRCLFNPVQKIAHITSIDLVFGKRSKLKTGNLPLVSENSNSCKLEFQVYFERWCAGVFFPSPS